MAVSWVSSGSILGSTGADITPTNPAHAAGDILILQAAARSNAVTLTTPSGWNAIAGPVDLSTTWRTYWYWIRATSGAMTDPLNDWSAVTGDKYGVVHVFRGAVASGTPYVASQTSTGTADPGSATGVTTAAAGQLVVSVGMSADNLATAVTITATDPASLAQHSYTTTATGADAGSWTASAVRATAGATGAVSHDFNAAPLGWSVLMLALDPAPVLPPVLLALGVG